MIFRALMTAAGLKHNRTSAIRVWCPDGVAKKNFISQEVYLLCCNLSFHFILP